MLISALEKNKVEQGVGNVLNGFTMLFIYLFRNYFTEKTKILQETAVVANHFRVSGYHP